MAQFFEVRTAESEQALYINFDTIPEFAVFDTYIEYKGLSLNREDFVNALLQSGADIKSLTPEVREPAGEAVNETGPKSVAE